MRLNKIVLVLIAVFFIFGVNDLSVAVKKTKIAAPTVKNIPTNSPYGRLIVKFSFGTPEKIKKKFFEAMDTEVIEKNVFGFDIAKFKKPVNRAKLDIPAAFRKIVITELPRAAHSILEYEIELPKEAKKIKLQSGCRPKNPQNITKGKLFAHWFDKTIGISDAHKFLEEKKAPLFPTGVVVIDEGPDFNHPDIRPALKYIGNEPIYWISGLQKPSTLFGDHGSHTSCLAAAYRDLSGMDGIAAPNAYILPMLMDFDESGVKFASDVARGLKYFKTLENACVISWRVVNMSFKLGSPSKIVYSAMEQLSDKLFVAAAGNSGDDGIPVDLDNASPADNVYPASWPLANKIAVAAIGKDDELADFSNYGKNTVAIAAPGVEVLSCGKDGKYMNMQGTSMAAPIITGTAALLFAMKPDLTVTQAKSYIFLGAVAKPALKGKVGGALLVNVKNSVQLLYNVLYIFNK